MLTRPYPPRRVAAWTLVLAFASVALTACPSSNDCSSDSDCKGTRVCSFGTCQDPVAKRPCGTVIAPCGCYGLLPGRTVGATGCDSGLATVEACGGACGGTQGTQNVCSCGATSSSGVTSSSSGGTMCSTLQGNVQTLGPPSIQCGQPGQATVNILQRINTFWSSAMQPCACDSPACPFNAWANPQTPGYIYYRRDILDWLTQQAGGDPVGAEWFLSHEAGHNLQYENNIPLSSPKAAELGADCLSGYFLAWLSCTGQANMGDIMNVMMAVCSTGDPFQSGWFDMGVHGTCTERIQYVQRGVSGYISGQRPSVVCSF